MSCSNPLLLVKDTLTLAQSRAGYLCEGAQEIMLGAGYRAGTVQDLFAGVPCNEFGERYVRLFGSETRFCALHLSLQHAFKHAVSIVRMAAYAPDIVTVRQMERATAILDFLDHPHLLTSLAVYMRMQSGEEARDVMGVLAQRVEEMRERVPFFMLEHDFPRILLEATGTLVWP